MARRGRRPHDDILTPREWEVLDLVRDGLTNEQISDRLGISFAGAKFHVSEIITKLGVSDRREAADWARRRTAPLLLAPWTLVRRLPGHMLTGGVAAAMVVVVGAVAALAWGVFSTHNDDAAASAWRYVDKGSSHSSVMLFDITGRTATRLDLGEDRRYAEWLKKGETFIARGDAVDDYDILDINGQGVLRPTLQGNLTRDVVPVPDGSALLVGRTDNQYIVSELPIGAGSRLPGPSRDLQFSLDGTRYAYTTVGGSDQDNFVHDFRSIIVGDSVVSGYAGGGMAVWSEQEADAAIELAPDSWSPDSRYLIVTSWPSCTAQPCDPTPTYTVYGTSLTGEVVWRRYEQQLLGPPIWAGPGHLFIAFKPGAAGDPDLPGARALVVDLGLQKQPVPDWLTESCCLSFSPDGRYAVIRHGTGVAWEQRCSLVETATWSEVAGFDGASGDFDRPFCAFADWTPDGAQVLVSAGGT